MSRKSDTTRRTKNMTCTVNLPHTHTPIPWKNILTEKYTRHMSTVGSRLVQTTCKTLNKNTNTYGWDEPAYFFEQYWTKHCLESGFSGSVLSFNLFDKVSGFWNYNNLALWRMSTHKWTEPGIQFAAYKKTWTTCCVNIKSEGRALCLNCDQDKAPALDGTSGSCWPLAVPFSSIFGFSAGAFAKFSQGAKTILDRDPKRAICWLFANLMATKMQHNARSEEHQKGKNNVTLFVLYCELKLIWRLCRNQLHHMLTIHVYKL